MARDGMTTFSDIAGKLERRSRQREGEKRRAPNVL
jgi:hypothetical protein